MKFNAELADQVIGAIEAHPEQHEQRVWVNSCGTAMCFAGWACKLVDNYTVEDLVEPNQIDDKMIQYYLDKDGNRVEFAKRARKILGLNVHRGDLLFAPNNTIERLKLLVKTFANEPDAIDDDDSDDYDE